MSITASQWMALAISILVGILLGFLGFPVKRRSYWSRYSGKSAVARWFGFYTLVVAFGTAVPWLVGTGAAATGTTGGTAAAGAVAYIATGQALLRADRLAATASKKAASLLRECSRFVQSTLDELADSKVEIRVQNLPTPTLIFEVKSLEGSLRVDAKGRGPKATNARATLRTIEDADETFNTGDPTVGRGMLEKVLKLALKTDTSMQLHDSVQ